MLGSLSRVLVLAPHTDDGELGAGGTIAKLARDGHVVSYLAFSGCEQSVPPEYPRDILRTEVIAATNELGIPSDMVQVLNFEVRHFERDRQEILQAMIDAKADFDPDVVFTPASTDFNQDHATISQESLRAFKHATLLGYEIPWNQRAFPNDAFCRLTQDDVETKIRSIAHYESQRHRKYTKPEVLEANARLRGIQADSEFAESFEVLRWYF